MRRASIRSQARAAPAAGHGDPAALDRVHTCWTALFGSVRRAKVLARRGPAARAGTRNRPGRVGLSASVAASLLSCAAIAVLAPAASIASTSQRITIFARPTTVGWTEAALLYGTARAAGPSDVVGIEVRECGSSVYQTVMEAHVSSGGGWSAPVAPGVTASIRASWKSSRSASVTIRQQARVSLERRRSGAGFLVAVTSKRSLWQRGVEVQRRSGSTWRTVKRVRLTDSVRSTGAVSVSQATFGLRVRSGTRLRAVLSAQQARPCYARSTSKVIRA